MSQIRRICQAHEPGPLLALVRSLSSSTRPVVVNHEGSTGKAAWEGTKQYVIGSRTFALDVSGFVGIKNFAYESPVWFDEDFASEGDAALDRVAEMAGCALGDEYVYGFEDLVLEDHFEELIDMLAECHGVWAV